MVPTFYFLMIPYRYGFSYIRCMHKASRFSRPEKCCPLILFIIIGTTTIYQLFYFVLNHVERQNFSLRAFFLKKIIIQT